VHRGAPRNTTFVATTEGTWRWLVRYGGDVNDANALRAVAAP
jgi:hypothetical protein